MNESIFDRPPKGALAEEHEELERLAIHNEGLYDEGEAVGGEKVDEATGKPYAEEDTVGAIDGLNVVDSEDDVPASLVGIDQDDPAARWLREHGGQQ